MRSSGITERRPMCLSSAFLRDSRSASNSSNSWAQRHSTGTAMAWQAWQVSSFRMFSGRLLCSARMVSNISSLGGSASELETRKQALYPSMLSKLDESWASLSGFMLVTVWWPCVLNMLWSHTMSYHISLCIRSSQPWHQSQKNNWNGRWGLPNDRCCHWIHWIPPSPYLFWTALLCCWIWAIRAAWKLNLAPSCSIYSFLPVSLKPLTVSRKFPVVLLKNESVSPIAVEASAAASAGLSTSEACGYGSNLWVPKGPQWVTNKI